MHYLIREYGISLLLLLGPITSQEVRILVMILRNPTTNLLACDTRTSIRVRD
jgi:hypothetical protein